jgi:hypothetical protein
MQTLKDFLLDKISQPHPTTVEVVAKFNECLNE